MMYVEWLRVRNVARVLAIVLGVFLIIGLILRISFNREISMDTKFLSTINNESGMKVSTTTLPDGRERKTLVSTDGKTRITIDDSGGGGHHITIEGPMDVDSDDLGRHTIGSIHAMVSIKGNEKIITADTDGPTPFIYLMVGADLMAFIIATVLAAPFARENDGHLELALTKPIGRTANALGIVAVDLAGIVLCSLMTVVALMIAQLMFEVPSYDFSGINSQAILMGFAFPFAWYAMINAATASLSRGYGAVQGFAWPVAILVVALAGISFGDWMLGPVVHNIFWVISRIDPLSYASFHITQDTVTGELQAGPGFPLRFAIELVLFAIYTVLAVIQWRRVEA